MALAVAAQTAGCFLDVTGPENTDLAVWGIPVVERGDTIRLTVTTDCNCSSFSFKPVSEATWSVTPSGLATIAAQPLDVTKAEPTASALLKGLAPGTVTVRAKAGKKHGDMEIRVYPVLERVTITPAGGTIRVGDTITVTGQLTFENDIRLPDVPFYVWQHRPDSGTGFVADATLVGQGSAVRIIATAPGVLLLSAGLLRKGVTVSFRVNGR